MSEAEYLEVARNDPTWSEVVASMQISGLRLDIETEILAGKMIVDDVSLREIVQIVILRSKFEADKSRLPTNESEP